MSDSKAMPTPDQQAELMKGIKAVKAALGSTEDVTVLNALLSVFCDKAFASGRRLAAAAMLQKMGRRMQRSATIEEFARGPASSIPVPTLVPSEVPEGYKPGEVQQIVELCGELSDLLDGWQSHVGLSALLSMYRTVAEMTADQGKAGEHLIQTGVAMVGEHMKAAADAAGMPPPTTSLVH